MTDHSPQKNLMDQLQGICVTLRQDLKISRHRYHGEASYLIYDPVTFQSHRLSLQDYRVVTSLRADVPLTEAFRDLVDRSVLTESDRESFYSFLFQLQRLGLLSIPFTNGAALFKQFEASQKRAFKSRFTGFLFIRFPLANPDRFLERNMRWVAPLFSSQFIRIWIIALLASVAVLVSRFTQLFEPLNGILALQNIPFLVVSFVLLKIWHELGHGFVCKHFGGNVPEMGMMLMAGMPLAYVDASASWGFRQRRRRLYVMLGGMFFESLVAIPAIMVWALCDTNSVIGACAYQLFFMAGITTLLFNANPLMKYDGYFIACELLGIPNLRQRSFKEMRAFLKRRFLGIDVPASNLSFKMKAIVVPYGILSTIYRTTVMLGIAAMLGAKYFVIGLLLAAVHIGLMLWNVVGKLIVYLLKSKEVSHVQTRARVLAAAVVLGIPLLLSVLPVPGGLKIDAVVSADQERIVRAKSPGMISQVLAKPGQTIHEDAPLVKLKNVDVEIDYAVSKATLQKSLIEARNSDRLQRVEAGQLDYKIEQQKHQMLDAQMKAKQLCVRSEMAGRVASCIDQNEPTRFLKVGDEVAVVVNGDMTFRAWLTADQVRRAKLGIGSSVRCRIDSKEWMGSIVSVSPTGVNTIEDDALTTMADGSIPINPTDKSTANELFRLKIKLPQSAASQVAIKKRGSILLRRGYEPIGTWIVRNCMRFVQKVLIS